MSQSISSTPQMCDIPLSMDEHGDPLADAHKMHASKTNSLKRFFKMPQKRVGGEQVPPTTSEAVLEPSKKDINLAGELGSKAGNKTIKEAAKRFSMRLGSVHKVVETADQGNLMSGSTSRLKSSISNYWNTVFKRTGKKAHNEPAKTDAEPEDNDDDDDDDDDAEVEAVETKIREEVHTLPISEDIAEEAPKP